jgi:nitrogenase molybdenum-iron protein beta chain
MKNMESLRTQCALQGALSAANAVEGVIPVVHSIAGCAYQNYLAGNLANGGRGTGIAGGLAVPSTNIVEKHVVFGGSARLREQLKNAVKVFEGKLFLVISGCTPNLVGDDSKAMADEIETQGYPTAYVQASGFHGSAYTGYVLAVKSLIDFAAKKAASPLAPVKGLVNIFGIAPGQDTFWQGDLLALSRDFSAAGLKLNPLFGINQTIDNWKNIPYAALNLSVSPWGSDIVEYLNEKFGTPALKRSFVPVGAGDTKQLLLDIAERLNIDEKLIKNEAERKERELDYFLSQFAEAYYSFNFQTDFSIAAPLSSAVGISRFLAYNLGFTPRTIVITDTPRLKDESIDEILPHIATKASVFFTEDQNEIAGLLKQENPGLILGSTIDKSAADQTGAAFLSVSFPLSDRIILNRAYAGYTGGVNLIEDIGSALIRKGYKNE